MLGCCTLGILAHGSMEPKKKKPGRFRRRWWRTSLSSSSENMTIWCLNLAWICLFGDVFFTDSTHGKITIQSPPSTALVGDHESWISNSVTRIRNVFGWCVFLKGGNYRFYRSDFGETGTCAIHPNRGYVFNNIGFCVKILKMSRWFPVFFGMNPRLPTPSSEGVLGYEVFGLQIPPITRCCEAQGKWLVFGEVWWNQGSMFFVFFSQSSTSTLLGTNISPKMAFWRWFSFSQGGIC